MAISGRYDTFNRRLQGIYQMPTVRFVALNDASGTGCKAAGHCESFDARICASKLSFAARHILIGCRVNKEAGTFPKITDHGCVECDRSLLCPRVSLSSGQFRKPAYISRYSWAFLRKVSKHPEFQELTEQARSAVRVASVLDVILTTLNRFSVTEPRALARRTCAIFRSKLFREGALGVGGLSHSHNDRVVKPLLSFS